MEPMDHSSRPFRGKAPPNQFRYGGAQREGSALGVRFGVLEDVLIEIQRGAHRLNDAL